MDTTFTTQLIIGSDTIQAITTTNSYSNQIIDFRWYLSAYLPLILAIIAGVVALFQVKSAAFTNSNLKWIESFRDVISKYCVEARRVAFHMEQVGISEKDVNILSSTQESVENEHRKYIDGENKLSVLGILVSLHLEDSNSNHVEMERIINEISTYLGATLFKDIDQQFVVERMEPIQDLAKEIIKEKEKKSKKLFSI